MQLLNGILNFPPSARYDRQIALLVLPDVGIVKPFLVRTRFPLRLAAVGWPATKRIDGGVPLFFVSLRVVEDAQRYGGERHERVYREIWRTDQRHHFWI